MPNDIVISDDLTTKLAAVNILLQTISESPVASLDTSLSVDVAAAVQAIDEVDRAFQAKGWHFNREEDFELSPGTDGTIAIPSNCLWVADAYWQTSNTPVRIAQRGISLYDRDNHTYQFADTVIVDMILKLDWEEMPDYARQYITIAAAALFQARLQGSQIVQRVTEADAAAKMALVEQREDEADEQNDVGGNVFVSNSLYGGPRRRHR